ncbi:MAG: 50S ribosomal protein L29 [Geobacteraceae bacterium]
MKVSDLKIMNEDALRAKDMELTKELFNLRFQLHTGRLENTARISSMRKDIARVKTMIQEKRG